MQTWKKIIYSTRTFLMFIWMLYVQLQLLVLIHAQGTSHQFEQPSQCSRLVCIILWRRSGWLAELTFGRFKLGHRKCSLFTLNRLALLLFVLRPQNEVAIAYGSEGLKSSKGDPTLCTTHRAGGQDYQCSCHREPVCQLVWPSQSNLHREPLAKRMQLQQRTSVWVS